MSIIQIQHLYKTFGTGENAVHALEDISLDIQKGEIFGIIGLSGAGKSTLVRCMNLLERPTSGTVIVDGKDIFSLKDEALTIFRRRKIGFVFQTFNLIPRTNAQLNVELPMMYAGMSKRERSARARELLDLVEMGDRARHLPNELSGGQKQRVSIARAMANDPAILLADEPTGALDSKTGRLVMDIFHKLNKEQGKTIVLITHNNELAAETDRIYTMRDGVLTGGEVCI